jgi:hypothetical protein
MLDAALPETRAIPRSQPQRFTWGIVDVILALVMLPFGIWMIMIEGMVNAASWLFHNAWEPKRTAL